MDPRTPQQLIDEIRDVGGFDSTSSSQADTQLLVWANAARAQAIAEARWRKVKLALGPTVAGQSEYGPLPDGLVDLGLLIVGGSLPYARVGADDMVQLQAGNGFIYGGDGAYAPEFDSGADRMVEIWPTPTTSGDAITGLATVLPASMALGDPASVVGIPADLQRGIIVHGAVAEGLLLVEEDQAGYQMHRQIWSDAKDKLKARGNSQIGRGAVQIRIER